MKDEEKKTRDIRQRAFEFALGVINLCKLLPKDEVNKVLLRQVLRSGTSIGANLEEAQGAHTRKEFINRTNISKKEARETLYWLKLIYESNADSIKRQIQNLINESEEIVKILTASVKKLMNKT